MPIEIPESVNIYDVYHLLDLADIIEPEYFEYTEEQDLDYD